MGWSEGFAQGVMLGRSILDTYNRSKQQGELQEIAEAKPEEETAPVATMQGFAGAAPDETGATSQMDLADAPMQLAKTGITRFLGKSYDKPLSDQQISDARMLASAGILAKTDPIEAARLAQGVQQGQRDAQRFEREQVGWQRQDAQYQKEQDYENGRADAFAGTFYGRGLSDYAQQLQQWSAAKKDYDAAVAAGQAPQGPAPVQPQRPNYTIGQSLADEAALLAHDAKFGRLDPAAFAKLNEKARAIEDEGYGKALRLAQGGAPLQAVAQAFNASGKQQFDPASVVSDKQVKGAGGAPSREITYKTPDGQVHTINTLAELDALGQAQDTFARYFKGREDARQEKELGIRGASLGIQREQADASIAHLNAQTQELSQKTADRKELGDIRTELTSAIESGDAAAQKKARDKLMAYTLSGKGGQNLSDLERRANFLLASGRAKNITEAAELAQEKVQSSPKDDFIKLTTGAMPLSGDQLESAMKIMHGDDWKAKVGGRSNSSSGGVPAPEAREVGKTYQTPKGPMIWRGTGWEPAGQ